MGSDSDLPTMRAAAEALRDFGVACEVTVPRCRQAPAKRAAAGQPWRPTTPGLCRGTLLCCSGRRCALLSTAAPAAAMRQQATPSMLLLG
jgi:hypothetical protein